jgi:hypothetical protein
MATCISLNVFALSSGRKHDINDAAEIRDSRRRFTALLSN